jgi:hypothetical protein
LGERFNGIEEVEGSNPSSSTNHNFSPLSRATSVDGTVQFLHVDHLGSPVAATDVYGSVVGTQAFYPFGEVRSGTGIFDTERGFTGARYLTLAPAWASITPATMTLR